MPLPPNASITDVINKLSELEGINQKTELASVIGAPATSTDTVAQQIVKLQDSKDLFATTLTNKGIPTVNTEPIDDMVVKVDSIITGIKFATGNVVVNSSTASYQYYASSSNATQYSAVFSGLNFKPNHIVLTPVSLDSGAFLTEYYQSIGSYSEYTKISSAQTSNSNSAATKGFKAQAATGYVNETGFSLPTQASGTYIFYAYG